MLENAVIKFECLGGVYSIILRELTKEQFEAVLDALQIPIIFVNGDVSQPEIKGWVR